MRIAFNHSQPFLKLFDLAQSCQVRALLSGELFASLLGRQFCRNTCSLSFIDRFRSTSDRICLYERLG